MHRQAPANFPMPVATVKSSEGEFAGYLLEYVEGVTLKSLVESGMLAEASLQLDRVEETVGRMHTKNLPHGDLNSSNIIAADDGRTVLIDPVAHPGSGTKLQDELCISAMRTQIEQLLPGAKPDATASSPRFIAPAPPEHLGSRPPNAGGGRPHE
jgi:serine/threonine protein kinase